jgi:hypothetical protein
MSGPSLDTIERFLFELFVAASLFMAVIKMLVTEWKSLNRLLPTRRPRCKRPSAGSKQLTSVRDLGPRHLAGGSKQLTLFRRRSGSS